MSLDFDIVKTVTFSEQKVHEGRSFPVTLTPTKDTITTMSEAEDWLRKQRAALDEALLHNGALLFRGFPIVDATAFDQFIRAFDMEALPYVGGAAPRTQITELVFTANEAPPDQLIPFHHEMAQVVTYPSVLFFYCDIAPGSGGQTPIAPSNLVYRQMLERHPQFVKELEARKVKYTRVLPDGDDPTSPIGRGWQSTFNTQDRSEAERKCREQGTEFGWLPDGCLKTTSAALPAVREDPRTGKKMWFNSIIAAYLGWKDSRNNPQTAVTFADDGSSMPHDVMVDLEDILNQLAAEVTWQKGDVIMVDNRQVLHARRSFVRPRRILASLAK